MRLRRPVKWVETRTESLQAMCHGRGQVQHVELGMGRDGRITGLRARVLGDAGAYMGFGGLGAMTGMMSQGPYRIPKIDFRHTSVVTNATPTGAYRGAGRPEAAALLERILDVAAVELGIDPVELRLRNLLLPEELPRATVPGAFTYDTGRYALVLEAACKAADYEGVRLEQRRRRDAADPVLVGIGVSVYLDVTPSRPFTEYGAVSLELDGDGSAVLVVVSGSGDHGQGHDTTFSGIVAPLFGLSPERVRFVERDTALVPRGGGSASARSLQLAGSAILCAGEVVVQRLRELAAHLLEADPADVVIGEGGRCSVAGVPARGLELADLIAEATPARLPDELRRRWKGEGLAAEEDYAGAPTFPYGAQVAIVEVDAETGYVRLRRHVVVDDCGTVINPQIVEGQQHGGAVQGIGQALYERVAYDEQGTPLAATFVDYTIPSAAELPSLDVSTIETPTPLNPLGAKGIGQLSAVGAAVAVQNAVVDALSHLGIRHLDMPLLPERVWMAVRDATAAGRAHTTTRE